MPFTIPNVLDASFPSQAEVDSGDFAALTAAHARSGVRSGCAVTPVSGVTVAVAAGWVYVSGVPVQVAGGTLTVVPDLSRARYALVAVSSAGAHEVYHGTASSDSPAYPTLPAGRILLAAVYVTANDASVTADQIIDKRVMVEMGGVDATDAVSDVAFGVRLVGDSANRVELRPDGLRFGSGSAATDTSMERASAGVVRTTGRMVVGASDLSAQLNVNVSGPSVAGIRVRAAASQTAPLVDLQDSAGSSFASFYPTAAYLSTPVAMVGHSTLAVTLQLHLNTAAGYQRQLSWTTAGVQRWAAYATNTAEGGSNAGSDWVLGRYADNGAYLGDSIQAFRNSGVVVFPAGVTSIGAGNLASSSYLQIQAAAGQNRGIYITSGNVGRWYLYANNTAESGSDAGSDFRINRYTDAGTAYTVLSLQRSNGSVVWDSYDYWIRRRNGVNGQTAGTVSLYLEGDTSQAKQLGFTTTGVIRWAIASNSAAESGSNAGSDLVIYRYSDAGAYIATALSIARSTGAITIGGYINDGAYFGSGGSAHARFYLNAGSGYNRGILSYTAGAIRWQMLLGNGAVESGSNVGTDFSLYRYTDAGGLIGTSVYITRSTGDMAVYGNNFTVMRRNGVEGMTAGAAQVIIDADAGQSRYLQIRSGGLPRWVAGAYGSAEGGSNTGTDFVIVRYNDAGASLGTSLYLYRADGAAVFDGAYFVIRRRNGINGMNAGASWLAIDGDAAQSRMISFQTAATDRWRIQAAGDAETGSNAGSSLVISRCADNGSYIGDLLTINRSSNTTFDVANFAVRRRNGINGLTSGALQILLDSEAAQDTLLVYRSGGVSRWSIQKDGVAESGSNAGSNLAINAYNDAGSYLFSPVYVYRSTGQVVVTTSFAVGSAGALGGMVGIQPSAAGVKGLVIRGAASQSANLLEVQDSGGTPTAVIDSTGKLTIASLKTTGTASATNHLRGDGAWTSIGYPVVARRTSNATAVNNSTTFVADAVLTVAVDANATYKVECFIVYDGSVAGDLKIGWNYPSGTTGTLGTIGLYAGSTALGNGTAAPIGFADDISSGRNIGGLGVGSTLFAQVVGYIVTSSTAGNLQLKYAQVNADATNLTVQAGSTLVVTRVA